MDAWVEAFTQILAIDMGPLETQTQDVNQVDAFNREKGWKLKGIVAATVLDLLQKYDQLLSNFRFGPSKSVS